MLEREKARKERAEGVRYELKQVEMDRLVGRYGGHRIQQSKRALVFMFNGNTPLTLVATSPTTFEFKESAGTLQFETGADGMISEAVIRLDAAGIQKAKKTN